MIWIFDSGSWWKTLLSELEIVLPDYDYLYSWDYENCPYGNKSWEEIYNLTKLWVLKLKKAGAKLIILACNTAISNSIRKLQQNEKELWVKVLWVTIPWAEKIVEKNIKKVSVLATHSSVKNKLYKSRVGILDKSVEVQEIWLKDLAYLVEKYLEKKLSKKDLEDYVKEKTKYVWSDSEAILLGCTHYSHIKDIFQEIFPNKTIICPSFESARKLKKYLEKHKDLEKSLTKKRAIIYL